MRRRSVLKAGMSAAGIGLVPAGLLRAIEHSGPGEHELVIVGAGTAGIPAAIFAAERGARVLLLESAPVIGGTLHYSTGQMSAAGTRLQAELGIEDTPDAHFEDVVRISEGSCNRELVRLAVDLAADTLDWLTDWGFTPLPGHPVKGAGHEFYSERRYLWADKGGVAILDALRAALAPAMATGRITMKLSHRATALEQGSDGRITGVVTSSGEDQRLWRGRNFLLATGGYTANTELAEKLDGYPQYASVSYPHSRGDGLELARALGARLRGEDNFLPGFGAILADYDHPSGVFASFISRPDTRMPWEIYVNALGERFIREDEPSVHKREVALGSQPDLRYWVIFDEGIIETAPSAFANWAREDLRGVLGRQPMFYSGSTVSELASAAGLPAGALEHSIAEFNSGVARGLDRFGREHLPREIDTPPYHAVRVQGFRVTSTSGVIVDDHLRVLDAESKPFPNLYAAGEILGSGVISGKAFVGGMSVTPALSFGRHLGKTLPLMRG